MQIVAHPTGAGVYPSQQSGGMTASGRFPEQEIVMVFKMSLNWETSKNAL